MDRLLEEINTQLIEQSLYIQSGEVSIINASVIEASLLWQSLSPAFPACMIY